MILSNISTLKGHGKQSSKRNYTPLHPLFLKVRINNIKPGRSPKFFVIPLLNEVCIALKKFFSFLFYVFRSYKILIEKLALLINKIFDFYCQKTAPVFCP